MKKIAILIFIMFFSGCSAKYPLNTNLELQVNSQAGGIYSNDISATLKGHDARLDTAVVVYQLKGKPEIRIPNQTAPHILVTEQLANGLEEQGLVFKNRSPVSIQLDLNDLLVLVTRPKILYSAKAKSHLTLTIKNKTITLTKTYDREANNDSATRPPVYELEKLLNDQLTGIVNQILQDEEVQETISQM
ncbi:MAG: hypothetical protein GY799_02770 [Desulfobulbaceae bacterium]|nr:hypothetical protein [Desulfobulbaceae bacterium]